MLQSGGWQFQSNSTIISCLMSTLVPAYIVRIFNLDPLTTFNIFPCLFLPLMPAFTYLIARTRLSVGHSICASALILLCSMFFYRLDRVGIALGFLAVAVWCVITGREKRGFLFAMFIPFSHYGTTFYSVVLLGLPLIAMFVYRLIKGTHSSKIFFPIAALVVVTITIFMWYGVITKAPASAANSFINGAIRSAMTASNIPEYGQGIDELISPRSLENEDRHNFYSLSSREMLIQEAFGRGSNTWGVQKKAAFVVNWLIMIVVSIGVFRVLRNRQFTPLSRVFTFIAYGLLALTVIIPYLSVHYGVGRVYFTGLILLAPAYSNGMDFVGRKLRVNGVALSVTVLVAYSWLTHGLLNPAGLPLPM